MRDWQKFLARDHGDYPRSAFYEYFGGEQAALESFLFGTMTPEEEEWYLDYVASMRTIMYLARYFARANNLIA